MPQTHLKKAKPEQQGPNEREVLRRLLNTPPAPFTPKQEKKKREKRAK